MMNLNHEAKVNIHVGSRFSSLHFIRAVDHRPSHFQNERHPNLEKGRNEITISLMNIMKVLICFLLLCSWKFSSVPPGLTRSRQISFTAAAYKKNHSEA